MTYVHARNHCTPVPARARTDEEMWGEDVRSGDHCITVDPEHPNYAHILCLCPCNCGSMMNLPLFRTGTPKEMAPKNYSGANWEWNGDVKRPSLAPSIRDLSGCHFHGHLRDGVWTFEGDSGA